MDPFPFGDVNSSSQAACIRSWGSLGKISPEVLQWGVWLEGGRQHESHGSVNKVVCVSFTKDIRCLGIEEATGCLDPQSLASVLCFLGGLRPLSPLRLILPFEFCFARAAALRQFFPVVRHTFRAGQNGGELPEPLAHVLLDPRPSAPPGLYLLGMCG